VIRFRRFPAVAVAVAAPALAPAARAEEPPTDAIRELQRRMEAMDRRHREEMETLRAEVERLRAAAPAADGASAVEDALDDYLARLEAVERASAAAAAIRPPARLVDFSLGGLLTAGASSASEAEMADLFPQHHDPHRRGFTVQNMELTALGAVDPYLRAEAHLVWTIDEEGETTMELEELFAVTTALPAGLQVKAGHFFTEFGRHNPLHPHAWEFADAPVIATRILGADGMRAPGVQASWLAPTGVPLVFTAAALNANGETMASFASEEPVAGRPAADRDVRSLSDVAYAGRIGASFAPGEETTLLLGASAAAGPNATGSSGRSRLLGVDLTLKWKPAATDAGWPFLSWTTEAMARRYHADEFLDPPSGLGWFPHATLRDRGMYSQVVWGFSRGWTAAARWEYAGGSGDGAGADPGRDRRTRGSLALTYYPSEFHKIRLQVNRDRSGAHGKAFTSLFLQLEFLLGAHGAHKF
jgi:hypothetical protein